MSPRSGVIKFPKEGRWLFAARPSGKASVKRLNLSWFCDFGAALDALANIPMGSDLNADITLQLTRMRPLLGTYLDRDTTLNRSVSSPTASDLNTVVQAVLLFGQTRETNTRNLAEVRRLATHLKILIGSELDTQPVYHVGPKRAYNLDILIHDATKIFAGPTYAIFPDKVRYDIEQAGKCLAFEVPTAAAFHLFRAAEEILRLYYQAVVGNLPKTRHRNWGAYIKILRDKGAEPKVVTILEQIKELHRNPILHPDMQLSIDEAMSLVGMIESVISAMLAEIQKHNPAVILGFAPMPTSSVIPMPSRSRS